MVYGWAPKPWWRPGRGNEFWCSSSQAPATDGAEVIMRISARHRVLLMAAVGASLLSWLFQGGIPSQSLALAGHGALPSPSPLGYMAFAAAPHSGHPGLPERHGPRDPALGARGTWTLASSLSACVDAARPRAGVGCVTPTFPCGLGFREAAQQSIPAGSCAACATGARMTAG